MKTTGLEAVLNALRGEAGLSGADKKDGGENAAFLAAFDAAARSAGEKPEVNGPPATRPTAAASPSRAAVDGNDLPDSGRPSPDNTLETPAPGASDDGSARAAEQALNASPFVQDALEKAGAGAVFRDRTIPASGASTLAAAVQNASLAGRDAQGAAPQNPGLPNAERAAGVVTENQAFADAVRNAAAKGGPASDQAGISSGTPNPGTAARELAGGFGQAGTPGNTGQPATPGALASAQAQEQSNANALAGSERSLSSSASVSQQVGDRGVMVPGNGAASASPANQAAEQGESQRTDGNPRAPVQSNATLAAPGLGASRQGAAAGTLSGLGTSPLAEGELGNAPQPGRSAGNAGLAGAAGATPGLGTSISSEGESGNLPGAARGSENGTAEAGRAGQNAPRDASTPRGDAGAAARSLAADLAKPGLDGTAEQRANPGAAASAIARAENAEQRAARLATGLRPAVTTAVGTESATPASTSPTTNTTLDTLVSRSADAPVTPADARFELPTRAEIGQEAAPRGPDGGTNPTAVTNTQGRAGDTQASSPLANLPDLKAAPDSPDFPQEILGRLRMMQGQNGTEARLNLHPAELGRLQIAISSEGEATRVAFVVDNAQAKEALEQAMPRLREFLAQAGLQLADGSVSQQGQSNDFGTGEGSDANGNALAAGEGPDTGDEPDATTQGGGKDSDRIFDAYA